MASAQSPPRAPIRTGGLEAVLPTLLWVRLLFGLSAVAFVAYAAWLIGGPRDYVPTRDSLLYCSLLVVPVVSFIARGVIDRTNRAAWWFFAAGATIWLAAEVGFALSTQTDPEPAAVVDWLFIASGPCLYVGALLLARRMLRPGSLQIWLDALIIALATSALGTLLMPQLLDDVAGGALDVILNLAAPLMELLLLSLVIAVLGLVRHAAGPLWWFLLAGSALLWVSDLAWLFQSADGSYVNGSLIDLGWPTALLLMAYGAWVPMTRQTVDPELNWALPLAVTIGAFMIVLYATQTAVPAVTVILAAGAVLAGSLRSVQAFRSASARAEAHRQAHSDDLTGLANRRGLAIALDADAGRQHALLLIDIDHFKQINDTLGHQAGDEVLQQVGGRFHACVGSEAVVARLGGDEFAVLLGPETGWASAAAAADRLHDSVNTPVFGSGIELQVEISVGIALAPQHGRNLSELLRTADRAMYRAKRDRVGSLVFDQAWDSGDGGSLMMLQELRRAMDSHELVCHYQPQLDVLTNEVVCVEALVRWQHPIRGLIPASDFLPLLEQTALIRPLSDLTLDTSLAQLAAWDALGIGLRTSVNLSATNLIDQGLPLRVTQMLTQHHIAAERLTLEITETAITGDLDRVRGVLGQLHEIGVQISIDDYGSGYSSLRQIGRLSAQELKLDRDFVTGVGQRGDLRSILSATVHLAHGLRLRMVAEGVESATDLDQIRLAGCDLAQGYYISAPRNAGEVTRWLLARQAANARHRPRGDIRANDEPPRRGGGHGVAGAGFEPA
ncbi:MAG: EAL domain-containing protein [Candidatus Nanopelagicales bacterium]